MTTETCTILHVDMDAFYASIEQRDQPELAGRPVIVGSSPDERGVVSAASYEAREYGVHSAMPSRTAGALCPDGVFVPVDMERYAGVSRQLRAIFQAVTPLVEPISIDEAFLDVTGVLHTWPDAKVLAARLKERIRDELRLTASVGIAPNKFLAKLASDLEKPDGLTLVPFEAPAIERFLAPLPVETIWGIGKKSAQRLHGAGIQTVGDLQKLGEPTLAHVLGSPAMARHVSRLAHGVDDREVVTERQAKSVSSEHTFSADSGDAATCRRTLIRQAERVGQRLRQKGLVGTTGVIKVRFSDFTTLTRQAALPRPSQSDHDLLACCLSLYDQLRIDAPVRLLGFGVTGLSEEGRMDPQPLLFPDLDGETTSEGRRKLDEAVDDVRRKYGTHSLKRGGWPRGRSED